MKVLPLGQSVSRLDGVLKVTGGARFAVEHPLSDLAHATIVFSTIPKGRIQKIDTTEAEHSPGVLAVITHENAPKLKKTPSFNPSRPDAGSSGTDALILGTDEVYWNGFPLAVVVAETLDQAEAAAQLVSVTYKSQKAALTMETERANAFVPKEMVGGEEPDIKKGDANSVLAECAVSVGVTYRTPPYNHNPIEPHATTAHWEGDQLTVYDSSQYITGVKNTLATMFGLKPDNVRVLSPFVGGGFGSKGGMWPHVPMCVAAAKIVGRPVRLALSREGVFRTVGGRTPTEQHVAIGCDETGKIGSLIQTGLSATSTTNMFAEPFTFPARHLYGTPNMHLAQRVVQLDTVPNTFMRAPGESVGTFALESAMDELAYAANIDPVQLRLLNDPELDPSRNIPFSIRHFKEAFELGAEKFGWSARPMAPRSMRDGDTLIGWGVASALYPVYQFPAQAQVVLCSDGSAWGSSATHEMGMGTTTAQAIHLAGRLGLPVEKARFELGDTKFPEAGTSGGSSTTISVGAAVDNACELIIDQLLKLVKGDKKSPLRGAKADDIVARDSGLWLVKEPTKGETYEDILLRHGKSQLEAQGQAKPGMEQMRYSMSSYGAQFCEVRVSEDSGETRISRWVAAFDCGRVLNPKTTLSQFRGGIIMGIGMALMEETQRDARTARIMNPSLAEYHIPVNLDVPNIEAYFLDIPDPQTPMGAHGVGEIGITGVAAAVANAVFHATGKRIRELPITLDKLM